MFPFDFECAEALNIDSATFTFKKMTVRGRGLGLGLTLALVLLLSASIPMASTSPKDKPFRISYYGVLGVKNDAEAKIIKRAYLQLAKQHHPDKSSDEVLNPFPLLNP